MKQAPRQTPQRPWDTPSLENSVRDHRMLASRRRTTAPDRMPLALHCLLQQRRSSFGVSANLSTQRMAQRGADTRPRSAGGQHQPCIRTRGRDTFAVITTQHISDHCLDRLLRDPALETIGSVPAVLVDTGRAALSRLLALELSAPSDHAHRHSRRPCPLTPFGFA